ncbi:FAD-dependent oxidoreductase [Streptomyces monticola]|uniref:FAD-dependent oxidoreductase n=1 Tax=Streptomyces monticola TaxID=2666263 RepID=A0ABW2JDU9_9ACTN
MAERPHLAVVGAGPAGLAAALAAAGRGVRVTVLDSGAEAGGQFFRQVPVTLGAGRLGPPQRRGRTWRRLRRLLDDRIADGSVRMLMGRHVWGVEGEVGDFRVRALRGDRGDDSVSVPADAVLLATGGHERVLPFPGWTLPGVITAGGAQAMLKGGLVLPGRTVVVAGTGPLLLPVAAGLAGAGAKVAALVEAAGPLGFVRAAPGLAAFPGKFAEGALYAGELMRHLVPVVARHTVVEAHGDGSGDGSGNGRGDARIAAVTVAALDRAGRVRPGSERRIACDALAVGHGMLAHTDLAETLGCRIDGLSVAVDGEQRTSVPGVWAAGEATGIGGAALSLAEGHAAGLSIGGRLTNSSPYEGRSWDLAVRARRRERAAFAAVDRAYGPPPAHWVEQVRADTVVCRCEEVTAGAVRAAVDVLGAGDLRTVKLLTRAGMGWCQGRVCGPGVAGVAGCELRAERRPFARPVPLGVLARAEPGANPDHASDAQAESDAQSDSGAQAESDAQSDSGAQAEPDAQSDSGAHTESDADTGRKRSL